MFSVEWAILKLSALSVTYSVIVPVTAVPIYSLLV